MITAKERLANEQVQSFQKAVFALAEKAGVEPDTVFSYLMRKIREQAPDIVDDLRAQRFYSGR